MIIACPECSGKLSSVAPSCPHCGYAQVPSKPADPAPPVPSTKQAPPPEPLPELILPSDKAVRKAAQLTWSEWVHSSVWRLFFGAVMLLAALGLMILVFLLANRMNDAPVQPPPVQKATSP